MTISKTAEDVETYLGLNTLVVVPDFGSKKEIQKTKKRLNINTEN